MSDSSGPGIAGGHNASSGESRPTSADPTSDLIATLWNDYRTEGRLVASRNRIVEHYYPLVAQFTARIRHRLPCNADQDLVESAAGEGLVEAVERFDASRSPEFRGYAQLVMRSRIIDELRRQRPTAERGGAVESRHVEAASRLARSLGHRASEERIDEHPPSLSLRARAIIYFHLVENVSQREIARLLGISQPRVSQILRRALDQLDS